MLSLVMAALFFAGIHLGIAGTAMRERAIGILGENGYRGAFAAASVIGLGWLVTAYNRAPYLGTWGMLEWWKPIAIILMLPASLLVVTSGGIDVALPKPAPNSTIPISNNETFKRVNEGRRAGKLSSIPEARDKLPVGVQRHGPGEECAACDAIIVRSVIRGESRPETSSSPRRFFMAGRIPLDRLIARYDFADFNRPTADVTSELQEIR